MKQGLKFLVLAGLAAGVTMGGYVSSYAADAKSVYELNPVTVTAQRVEKNDLDTPANVEVVTAQKIENAGYKNAFDAIQSQVGVESTGYGDAGQDFGFSSGRTVVRGFDRGTLVMLNGIPMNLKNYNSLAGIPVDMIEKIEIVKGAGSTLYGSEAMGGLVNIITKTPKDGRESVTVRGTVGNYYNDYGVTYAGPNLIVNLSREFDDKRTHSNDYGPGSNYNWWVGKGQANRAAIAAKLTDNIGFNLFYQDGNISRGGVRDSTPKSAKAFYNYRYDDKRITTGLNYDGKGNGIKAVIGYNYRQVDGYDRHANKYVSSDANLSSYIADVQKTWKFGEDSLTAGYTFKRENYDGIRGNKTNAHRMNHALYLSYTDVFSPKFSATVGLRGERILDPMKNRNVLNPQFQTLYKFNDSTSWYINIGRGFQMPTVDSYYGTRRANGNIKPEKGWTYETGVKKNISDTQSVKFSVFHMDFDNKIGWTDYKQEPDGMSHPYNQGKFKNTGVEMEYEQDIGSHWNYSVGLGFSNPEVKEHKTKGDNPKWTQASARFDGVASVTYRDDKLRSTLSWKYLGDREDKYYVGPGASTKVPYLSRVTWNTIYDFTKNDSITVTLNNLFDHKNYSNEYGNLDLPYNWRISYSHKF